MSDLRLFLFGSPRIEYQGKVVEVERRKALALAAYVALAKRPYTRDTLADLLWPDLDQEHARAALRSTLPSLTSISPQPWLDIDRTAVKIKREAIRVDVHMFLDLLMQSRLHGHGLDAVCAECVPLLEQIVSLYSDDFLADFTLPTTLNTISGRWHSANGFAVNLAACCAVYLVTMLNSVPITRRLPTQTSGSNSTL